MRGGVPGQLSKNIKLKDSTFFSHCNAKVLPSDRTIMRNTVAIQKEKQNSRSEPLIDLDVNEAVPELFARLDAGWANQSSNQIAMSSGVTCSNIIRKH